MQRVHAESPAVGNQVVVRFGNPRPQLAVRRLRRIGAIAHGIERGKPHANRQLRRDHAYRMHDLAQKPRTIVQRAAEFSFSRMRAQKFMTQIPVAVLNINKIEFPTLPRSLRRRGIAREFLQSPRSVSNG